MQGATPRAGDLIVSLNAVRLCKQHPVCWVNVRPTPVKVKWWRWIWHEKKALYVNVWEQTIPSPYRPVSFRSVTHLPTCIIDRRLPPPMQGVPEDLLFFYQSIRQGGGVFRVDQCLLVYRYHEKATTHSVSESVPSSLSFTLWWRFHYRHKHQINYTHNLLIE